MLILGQQRKLIINTNALDMIGIRQDGTTIGFLINSQGIPADGILGKYRNEETAKAVLLNLFDSFDVGIPAFKMPPEQEDNP